MVNITTPQCKIKLVRENISFLKKQFLLNFIVYDGKE